MGEPEPLITDREVASMLGITLPALWGMCRRGAIPAIKIGRPWRFRRATIEAWIAEQEQSTARSRRQRA